jgi:cytidyltransferase-like protein
MWEKKLHVQSSLNKKDGQYAMFVGRWQPLHKGHQSLFKQAMDEGKNVLICIRDIQPDDKNPFTAEEVKDNIMNHYSQECVEGKVKVMVIPDICSTIDTMLLGWFVTGDLKLGLAIGGFEVITKMILYFLHERVWYKFVKYGLDK